MVSLLLLASCGQAAGQQVTGVERLERLSAERGVFGNNQFRPKTEKLRALERLGTNNLGNPYREWYFPAGSSSMMIWLINWNDDTGALVKQSVRGGKTYVDWVLDLRYEPEKFGPKPTGTLSMILWHLGYELAEKASKEQKALLDVVQGYAGFAYGRGPVDDLYTWYVYPDGGLRPYFTAFEPAYNHSSDGSYSPKPDVYRFPPVTQEEAAGMGIDTFDGWRPSSGINKTSHMKMTWVSRQNGVPGRDKE